MKTFGLILIILGSLLIAVNLITDFIPSIPDAGTEDIAGRIGFYIGFNFIAIIGGIFLWIGLSLRRKARRRKEQRMVENLFKKDPDITSNNSI